jgi:hypothetical protein
MESGVVYSVFLSSGKLFKRFMLSKNGKSYFVGNFANSHLVVTNSHFLVIFDHLMT